MALTEPEQESWEFDVALSFSGEHRSFVRALNNRLTELGVRVFFDEEYEAEMWGENLYDYLQNTYRTKARFVVAFASESYGTRAWPTLERQSAQARALQEVGTYLLPVRLDDSELPGILPTVGYLDARLVGLDGLVERILKKLGLEFTRDPDDPIPTTKAEFDVLQQERPGGWEYYLFAGLLLQGREALEDRWRDHQFRLKLNEGRRLSTPPEAVDYVQSAISQVRAIVSNLDRVVSQEVQQQAFGPPGTAGDWDMDSYMASRFISLYEQMLAWSADVRSARTPDEWVECFDILSRYCDQPISAVREAIDAFADFARQVPAHLANPDGPGLQIDLPIVFTINPELSSAFSAELERLTP